MIEKKYIKYNDFYKNKDCRYVILEINQNKCQGCGDPIDLNNNYHVGHIIPRSNPDFFKELFPKLNVDNIINLHALCKDCNLKANNSHHYSIFMLNQLFNENIRNIDNRLPKIKNISSIEDVIKAKKILEKNSQLDLFNNFGKKIKNKELKIIAENLIELENNNELDIIKNEISEIFTPYIQGKINNNKIIFNKNIDEILLLKIKNKYKNFKNIYILNITKQKKYKLKKEFIDLIKNIL